MEAAESGSEAGAEEELDAIADRRADGESSAIVPSEVITREGMGIAEGGE